MVKIPLLGCFNILEICNVPRDPKRQAIWKATCMQKIITMPYGTNLSPSKSTGVYLLASERLCTFSKSNEPLGLPKPPCYHLHFNRLEKLPEHTAKGRCCAALWPVWSCFLSTLLTMRAAIHMHCSNRNKLQRRRNVEHWQAEDLKAATTLKGDSLLWNYTKARIKPTNRII